MLTTYSNAHHYSAPRDLYQTCTGDETALLPATMPMPVVSAPASGRTPLSTSSAPLSPASLATLHTPRSFAGAARPVKKLQCGRT